MLKTFYFLGSLLMTQGALAAPKAPPSLDCDYRSLIGSGGDWSLGETGTQAAPAEHADSDGNYADTRARVDFEGRSVLMKATFIKASGEKNGKLVMMASDESGQILGASVSAGADPSNETSTFVPLRDGRTLTIKSKCITKN